MILNQTYADVSCCWLMLCCYRAAGGLFLHHVLEHYFYIFKNISSHTILRDDRGDIIYNTCREFHTCDSALEAELAACRGGLDLALHRASLPIMVEMDSVEAVLMLSAHSTE